MALVGLKRVEERIRSACDHAGRSADEVDLVVVSKTQPDAAVLDIYRQGQRIFAENREQGLKARIASDLPADIEWHFVGPLQSRKANFVGSNVALLHSMDRQGLAEKWATRSTAPVLLQFNLAAEPQKSGFDPSQADRVIDDVLGLGVRVAGVMAIPPMADDPEDVRQWFVKLRALFDRYASTYDDITVCSMGMSHDLEVAIEEGATMVRVGRAIFAG